MQSTECLPDCNILTDTWGSEQDSRFLSNSVIGNGPDGPKHVRYVLQTTWGFSPKTMYFGVFYFCELMNPTFIALISSLVLCSCYYYGCIIIIIIIIIIPSCNIINFTQFSAAHKNCPSARCASAANLVCSDTDTFCKQIRSLKLILPK
jgi:hypothetical protein